ncbi:MAG: diguanylate cyclase [Gallionellaceae bacterium]|nr:diguanylate cyclase [Gallionellaceae bacterium]
MINVTAQELESILSTIDKALAMHDAWREQIQRTVACRLAPQDGDMADDAHHRCAFGNWFYSPSNAHLRRLPSFMKIEEMHKVTHNHARELCIRLKGHWPISPNEYDPYIEQVAHFRAELIQLRQKVFDTLHKIDPLTGAYCGVHILPDLEHEQTLKRAQGQAYSLLMLQFDLLEINQAHGRAKGDEILRASITGIRDALGSGEKVYRYASAEFVICLPGKDGAEAFKTKENLLAIISQAVEASVGNSAANLDIHYAITDLEPDTYIEQLISQAERATYTIKI